jgi:hypothetical protein
MPSRMSQRLQRVLVLLPCIGIKRGGNISLKAKATEEVIEYYGDANLE